MNAMVRTLVMHQVTGKTDGDPVVLMNGGLMTFLAWEPVAAGLRPTYRIVTFDFRGQLLSPGPPPASLDGHVDDVLALLDHLAIERAHLVGTSFGAEVGLLLAARAPERVRSVTAVTATERVTAEMWRAAEPLRAACRSAAAGGDGGVLFDLLVPATFSPAYRAAQAALLAERRRQVAAMPPAWFDGVAALLGALEGLDLTPVLPRVACPVLVVGAALDETFPVEHSRALAAGIAGARLEVVEGSGHALVAEAPERLVAIVRSFLAEVTRGRQS